VRRPVVGKLLSAREVALKCNIPEVTIYYWARTGEIPHIRLGKRLVRFPEEEINRWLADRARQSAAVAV
jgi:excisionase family DNA binding protein